jgi:hypothetical protein
MQTLRTINAVFAAGNLDLDFYNALLAGQREHIVSFKALGDEACTKSKSSASKAVYPNCPAPTSPCPN